MSNDSRGPHTGGPGGPSSQFHSDGDIESFELASDRIAKNPATGKPAAILSLTLTEGSTRHYFASESAIRTLLDQLVETYSAEMVRILETKGLIPAPFVRR